MDVPLSFAMDLRRFAEVLNQSFQQFHVGIKNGAWLWLKLIAARCSDPCTAEANFHLADLLAVFIEVAKKMVGDEASSHFFRHCDEAQSVLKSQTIGIT